MSRYHAIREVCVRVVHVGRVGAKLLEDSSRTILILNDITTKADAALVLMIFLGHLEEFDGRNAHQFPEMDMFS